ncbi:MAG TPA: hypothetical protein VKU62_10285, partial [Thermoanaerobaculia bacterium]|nr:hypothetical protein [Thermoanaerobaculia bacterium]
MTRIEGAALTKRVSPRKAAAMERRTAGMPDGSPPSSRDGDRETSRKGGAYTNASLSRKTK